MRCDSLSAALAGATDGSVQLDRSQRRHVEHCLRCQAEAAQYRKLLRALASLQPQTLSVPSGAADQITRYLDNAGDRSSLLPVLSGRKAAYIGGIAAAAGAGAALVLARRRLPLAG